MKRISTLLLHWCAFALLIALAYTSASAFQSKDELAQPVPVDPKVKIGKLANGLTYYIRENKWPENRAEFRLVVNAGSILEDEDQRGLAHMVEHMAFKGTTHFKNQEIIQYMQSIGMRFGADLNAYTNYDQTVYQLTIPTDRDAILTTAFQILADWSHNVTFDSADIDKERNVVIEEWRLKRGAGVRIADKQNPVIFHDSRYAVRDPIGKKEILDSFAHARLVQFYKDWYRPDLIAVVAVGDFDAGKIEKLITENFSAIPAAVNPRERTLFPVPDHRETLFGIAGDSEATSSSVNIGWYHVRERDSTVADYRRTLVTALYDHMLNRRFYELGLSADPPFLNAYVTSSGVRTKVIHMLGATLKDNGYAPGLRAILEEAARVRAFGFTATEFEREKKEALGSIGQEYNEREKTESVRLVNEYVGRYLAGGTIPGIEKDYELYKELLPGITLEEIRQRGSDLMPDSNCVLTASGPLKTGVTVPTEQSLRKLIDSVAAEKLSPYVDKTSEMPLVANPPIPGSISQERELKEIGVTEWILSNRVRVVLKPSKFKEDEVLFSAFSPGGSSVVADSDYIPCITATNIVAMSGAGAFDQVALAKKLEGSIARVSPYIGELEQGISGGASPKDLETMFQLVYLYATAPRADSLALLSYKDKMRGFLQNRNARPETAFQDTIAATLSQYHLRRMPFSEATLEKLDRKKSLALYRQRFADASSITCVIVGSFDPDAIKPLVLTYIGSLPSTYRYQMWKDVGVNYPQGVIAKSVSRGIEPKSSVSLTFTGPFSWTGENRHNIRSLTDILNIKLVEDLRQDKGGVYGVSAGAAPVKYPRTEYRLAVGWGCAPNRVDELLKAALGEIDSIKQFGVSDFYINKVKETQRREREVSLKENRFWLNFLETSYRDNEDPRGLYKFDELVDKVNSASMQKAAQTYFDMNNYVKVVLYPDSTKSGK